MKRGVVYVGVDEKYLLQAVASAESLKRHTNMSAGIFTTESMLEDHDLSVFDDIITIDTPYHDVRDKSFNLAKTPYNRTLYLDGDTKIIDDITPVFKLLERVNIAAVHDTLKEAITIKNVPSSFPQYNTGVILFDDSIETNVFFELWNDCLSEQIKYGRPNEEVPVENGDSLEDFKSFGRKSDQAPFREALYKSDISFSTLPTEYNFGAFGNSYAYRRVKILHGKKTTRDSLEKTINNRIGRRIYLGGVFGKIYYVDGYTNSINPPLLRLVNFLIRKLKIRPITKKLGLYEQLGDIYNKYRGR